MGTRLFVGGLLFMAYGSLLAQDNEIQVQSTEIVPGLYMLDGVDGQFAGGNMSLLIGSDGVILIDDGLPTTGPALLAAIAELTGAPVIGVIPYFRDIHIPEEDSPSAGNVAGLPDGAALLVA